MKSRKLRGLLDLAAGGAVLIGLVFVGLELRQNTAAVEAASLQNMTDASTDYLLRIASDVELTRIWIDGTSDQNNLSEIDSYRYFLLSRARWLRMQNSYLQWRRGTLSDEDWSFYKGLICGTDADGTISFKATWSAHNLVLTERFVNFVDACWTNSQ